MGPVAAGQGQVDANTGSQGQDDPEDDGSSDEEYNAEFPTESDWKTIQCRNRYLERQNYLLQKMINLQIDYKQEKTQITSSKG